MYDKSEIDAVVKLRNEGKNYNEIAAQLGLTVDQAKKRFYASGKPAPEKPAKPVKEPVEKTEAYKLGGTPQDRKIIQLTDELKRLKKEIEVQHRSAIDEEVVREILGTLAAAPVNPPDWLVKVKTKKAGPTSEVPITSWADWHAGEVVSLEELNGVNQYNMNIMDARVRTLVEKTINLARNHAPGNYPGIVINLQGDMVSGGLHEEHRKTDEMEAGPCALHVADTLVWGLQKMADEFGHVYCPAVSGNHGRQTVKPEFKRYIYKNWDWLIYNMVQKRLMDMKDDRIKIDIRPSNEVYYRVWDTRYMSCHGDMLGVKGGDGIIGAIGPIMRGEVKTRGRAASSGMEYDIIVMGHWHQSLWLPRAIVANTLKGYCEYAKSQLSAIPSAPSQPLWFNHPKYGITSRWEIKVEDNKVSQAEWCSVFDPMTKINAA